MLWLVLIGAGGLLAGAVLLQSVPTIPITEDVAGDERELSLVIPARNEEKNLPPLLESIRAEGLNLNAVVVVDDGSTDGTADVARAYGTALVRLHGPPSGWTGKTWACDQGAAMGSGDRLLFLDADTRFVRGGLGRAVRYSAGFGDNTAVSILPFQRTCRPYEELSLFFVLNMAIGAGGFTGIDRPRLFGQSLMLKRALYQRAGTYSAVRNEILENLHFADVIESVGGRTYAVGGRGVLEARMFPDGVRQLCESWRKAFAVGAGATSKSVVALASYWMGAATLAFLVVLLGRGAPVRIGGVILYCAFVLQIGRYARQLGSFRLLTAALYPLPLLFYFVVFGQSAWLRVRRKPVQWRGRDL